MKKYIKILVCAGIGLNMHAMERARRVEEAPLFNVRDPLVRALENNNQDEVQRACLSGDIPNVMRIGSKLSYNKISPLTLAITNDAWDVAQLLLKCPGIDINTITRATQMYAPSPLMAVIGKQEEGKKFFDILLRDRRIDVNKGNDETTPLIEAVRLENAHAIERLLNHPKIKVDAVAQWGNESVTAERLARLENKEEIIKLFEQYRKRRQEQLQERENALLIRNAKRLKREEIK